jgi:RNA polymerase primary sigma factor
MNIKNLSTKFFGTNKTLSLYLSEIRKTVPPTSEEERELFERIKNGDEDARTEIIVRHQKFVYSIAKVYARSEDDVLEYVNEGNIGLMQAIDEYNPDRGTRFLTFAVWYMRRAMNYYQDNTNNMIVRSNNMKLSKKIDKVREDYFKENGIMPTDGIVIDLIKEKYDIDIKDVRDVYDVNVSSISDEIDDDFTIEENSEYNSKTASINEYEMEVDNDYKSALIEKLMGKISGKQADMIKMLYGVGYDRQYTIDEIALKYNMYPEDTQSLINKIMQYLKQEGKLAV